MSCPYGECELKELCPGCPTIDGPVSAPTVVNVGDPFDIIVRVKSNATFIGDDIDLCLYEGNIPEPVMSTGKFRLNPGQTVTVTFPRQATLAVTLFYNVSLSTEIYTLPSCLDFRKFEVRCTSIPKRYSCINNACQEKEGGEFDEPRCGEQCLPPEIRYNCVDGYCQKQDGGPYTNPNCDSACLPEPRYRCSDTGNCIEDPQGDFTYQQCQDGCTPLPTGHNVCQDGICKFTEGAGTDECTPVDAPCEKCWIYMPFMPGTCLVSEKDKMMALIVIVVIIVLIAVLR